MRFLITRPELEGGVVRTQLEAMGHEGVLLPLFRCVPALDGFLGVDDGVQAVVLTSARVPVEVLQSVCGVPVFAVGNRTAECAIQAGVQKVVSAGGAMLDLMEKVCEQCDPTAGRIIYLSGDVVHGNLEGMLVQQGFAVERQVVYRMEPVTEVSLDGVGDVDAVMFYSARAARRFEEVVLARYGKDWTVDKYAFCLSDLIKNSFNELKFSSYYISEFPNHNSLVSLVKKVDDDVGSL